MINMYRHRCKLALAGTRGVQVRAAAEHASRALNLKTKSALMKCVSVSCYRVLSLQENKSAGGSEGGSSGPGTGGRQRGRGQGRS